MDIDSIPFSSKGNGKASNNDFSQPEFTKNYCGKPLVEKYRSVILNGLVSHKGITSTIEKFIEKKRLPHILLYGSPGTGKTSTILAVARRIYGEEYRKQILELNASDDRGIDIVREQIKQSDEMRTFFSKGFKVIVLDEADIMTQAEQAALRRVIQQYTKIGRFCIICDYVDKIALAIQNSTPLPSTEVEERINLVIETEKLLKLSEGDVRCVLNVLQACHAAYDMTSETEIYHCTGSPYPSDIETIVKSTLSDELITVYQLISTMKTERGLAFQDLLVDVYEYIETIQIEPYISSYICRKQCYNLNTETAFLLMVMSKFR
ncbi:P-loop containing nucleoside triphosphate hydrolase protein [Lentinula edodes]|nr:P-loop containing nucleoside triphosphate hydrolase protein [Lentinula edodes]